MSGKRTVWSVTGMHCVHCETAVVRAVSGLPGLKEARANYKSATLTAAWDEKVLPQTAIEQALSEAGYGLRNRQRKTDEALRIVGMLFAVIALYLLVTNSPLSSILSAFPVAQEGMSLGALFLVGVMTSVHCVAMCGGIHLSHSAQAGQNNRDVLRVNLLYQLGRVVSYTVIGALVGALGSVLSVSSAVRGGIQLLAALFMLLMAINLLGGFSWTRRLSFHLPRALSGRIAVLTRGRSSLFIGFANGLMPCGPLQAMQLFALSTGSALMGAASMLCFSLGTVPLMLAFGWAGGRLNARFGQPMRTASAVLVLMMGMSMFSSGLALTGVNVSSSVQSAPQQDDIAYISDGVQHVHSELDYGFYPAITVQAGMPVTWTLHAEASRLNGCNNAIIIPEFDLYVPLAEGDNIIEFTPAKAETIPYSCWMGMIRSTITVVDDISVAAPV